MKARAYRARSRGPLRFFQCMSSATAIAVQAAPSLAAETGWISSFSNHVEVDSSFSAAGAGWSSDLSGTFSPQGASVESGWRLRVTGMLGGYSYLSSIVPKRVVMAEQSGADLLAGYAFVDRNVSLLLLAGPSFARNEFPFLTTRKGPSETEIGVKTSAALYARPTSDSMMYANASYSTALRSYLATAKAGIAAPAIGGAFVGPELGLSGSQFYQSWRFGAHITGFNIAGWQLGLSAGYFIDDVHQSGLYGGLNVYTRF